MQLDTGVGLTWLSTLAQRAGELSKDGHKEKQDRLKIEEDVAKGHKIIEGFIQQGLCPYCGSNLIRGKKDRKNDYKRSWSCTNCTKIITN